MVGKRVSKGSSHQQINWVQQFTFDRPSHWRPDFSHSVPFSHSLWAIEIGKSPQKLGQRLWPFKAGPFNSFKRLKWSTVDGTNSGLENGRFKHPPSLHRDGLGSIFAKMRLFQPLSYRGKLIIIPRALKTTGIGWQVCWRQSLNAACIN